MSYNPNDQRQSTYGNPTPPPADPYHYYRPAPAPQKKPKTIPKVLIPFVMAGIGTLSVFALVPPGAIFAFYLRSCGIPYFAFLSAVGVISLIASCIWLKSKVAAGSPKDLRIVAANINEFPGLDLYEFQRYTTELQTLGFVYQNDYRTHTAKPGHPSGIARVMIHPEHRCVAEINQLNNKGNILKVHCNIMSYALRQKDDRPAIQWVLSTGNRELMSTGYAIRHPWSYATSIPGAGPAQLLQSHLSRRGEIVRQTGMQVADNISCETFFTLMQQSIDDRRKMLKRKNILALLLQIDLFEFRPKTEWSGKPAKS